MGYWNRETASPEQAQEMHAFIRSILAEQFGDVAQAIRLLYGGSMKPANAQELLSRADVDGGLIGGASVDAESFVSIIEVAESLSTKTIRKTDSSTTLKGIVL